jgi:hypothetical protein
MQRTLFLIRHAKSDWDSAWSIETFDSMGRRRHIAHPLSPAYHRYGASCPIAGHDVAQYRRQRLLPLKRTAPRSINSSNARLTCLG